MSVLQYENITIFKQALTEIVWPTRCAICDKPHYLLCPTCASKLPFIDTNKACNICGEPYGAIQCCGCSPIDKKLSEEEKLKFMPSYNKAISVVRLNLETGRIVSLRKDAGERRLSNTMAYFMYSAVPHEWLNSSSLITFIPSSEDAIKKRGFDHCEDLAKSLSNISNIPYIKCFIKPRSKDQRALGRKDRKLNLKGEIKLLPQLQKTITNFNIIIIDDVYTTGATLNAAATELKKVTSRKIYCLTFARTF